MTDKAKTLEAATSICRALADATRLRIMTILGEGEANVGTLCDRLGVHQPTVSHHLRQLWLAGLVRDERRGRFIFYRLVSPAAEGDIRVSLADAVVTVWAEAAPGA